MNEKYYENQYIKKIIKNVAPSPGAVSETRISELETPNCPPDLSANRLDLATLTAIGAGRPRPELLEVFQAEIAAAA